MSAQSPTRQSIAESFTALAFGFVCWSSLIAFIELAPKTGEPRATIRLVYLLGYFVAWICLVMHVSRSLPSFVQSIYRWRYVEAPMVIDKSWKNLVEEIGFVTKMLSAYLIAFLSTTALQLIGYWFKLPGIIEVAIKVVWLMSLVALALFVLRVPANLNKIFVQFRFLTRQVAINNLFQPRPLRYLWKPSLGDPPSTRCPSRMPATPAGGFVWGGRAWKLKNLCENLIVFGSIGAGKTICAMNPLLEKLVSTPNPSAKRFKTKTYLGGLVLDPNGDFHNKIVKLCAKHGRSGDLIVLSPTSPYYWNPLDTNEDARELASRFVSIMKALGENDKNTSFFFSQSETLLEHTLTLLRNSTVAGGHHQPPTFHQLYRAVNDEEYLGELLGGITWPDEDTNESDPLSRCRSYFTGPYRQVAEERRGDIAATLNNMLDPLCGQTVSQYISKPGGVRVSVRDASHESKVLYLQLPIGEAPKAARVLATLLKLSFYGQVRQKEKESSQYSFLFSDEFQEFYTGDPEIGDTAFFRLSRQRSHINIVATQNISNLRLADSNTDSVDSFLSLNKTKVFLQNGHSKTNELASDLFGKCIHELGGGHMNSSATETKSIPPEVFMTLRKPERNVRAYAEAVIMDETVMDTSLAQPYCELPVHEI